MSLLENIRVFVRVVEQDSMSAAGRQLRLSPAVVSHRIQSLEAHLGVRLLNRTTRRVQPTEQGLAFYQASLEVIASVERAENVAAGAGGAPQGTLRVTAPLGFARRILAPLVPEFQAAHPQVTLQLRLSEHIIDLLTESVDVAVRMAILSDSSLIARKITDCERVLCAAPAYLSAAGIPEKPEDLLDHNCLLLRFPGSQQYRWTLQSPDGPQTLSVRGSFDADDGDVLTAWALAGQGIAMKPLWEVAELLRDGSLVPVLTDHPPEPATLSILYPHRRLLPARVKVFADFAVSRLAQAIEERLQGTTVRGLQERKSKTKAAKKRP
ncbi:LysR family transcriptional regulator [Pelagibius litoralis]|uniref:LysR family transcriptional regulator n=1 Tax=Pelagibius litoralis TaxID=374515 RepID=A0A967CC27_9PROT|nr:LysR family transcriptional regulator [Pelagibius litoralis]NIA68684.1 LysR family transcriptional regulator [Pelagibius litoralis]